MFSLNIMLEVSIRGVSLPPHRGRVLRVIPRQMLNEYHLGDRRRDPANVCSVTSGGVLSCVTQVIIRLLVGNAKKYHRGVVFCGGGFFCGWVWFLI